MIKKLKIELAVFLMIALVAFGGFASILSSQSDDLNYELDETGNELTGDALKWKPPKINIPKQTLPQKSTQISAPVSTTSPGETCLARGEKPRLGACCDKNNKCTTTGETACYAWHGVRWIQGKTCPWFGRGPC